MSAVRNVRAPDIKQVPNEKAARNAIREQAVEFASDLDTSRPPVWNDLESRGRALLCRLALPQVYLGYAMVTVSNEFWRRRFESVPFDRRLLLLSHCLSDKSSCVASRDSVGLRCENCGACDIGDLKARAEKLGYEVIAAEGTSSAVMKVLEGDADAILGVACLDSLEKSYTRVVELGIPHIAVPLLRNGCVNTEAEIDEIVTILNSASGHVVSGPRSYLPLLRETARIFDTTSLLDLLPRDIAPLLGTDEAPDSMTATEAIALDWLGSRGKRLRPFITVSAYAVARHGSVVTEPDTDPVSLIPKPVRRIALAIEALHKASLVHDDIEDNDEFRYGRRTIHKEYGVPPAINIGDYLVGLGYRLVAGEASTLGAECVADILSRLSSAHLDLCRGQGAELLWHDRQGASLRPIDALSIYALKTAPALEVALYAGLRAGGVEIDGALLRQFCVYLGEGYQILNDFDDWDTETANHVVAGGDVLAERPTILRAFALEAGGGEVLEMSLKAEDNMAAVDLLRKSYSDLGAFDKAQRLLDRLRDRARDLAGRVEPPALRELMDFLIGIMLPERPVL
ncbi:MAG: polyprenyl synthetase family protein [Armatimonadetes bacterium]|nr:polyprenyl synthetase family protein [Armatimonadota bacterium]